MTIVAIDHVQLAMPAGQEQAAREFYLPGQARCFVHDPFGNRLELLAASPSASLEPAE